jgi:hypothetical protein
VPQQKFEDCRCSLKAHDLVSMTSFVLELAFHGVLIITHEVSPQRDEWDISMGMHLPRQT